MSCPWFCCCLNCCLPKQDATDKYPHIEYKASQKGGRAGTQAFSSVPLEKIFGFQQSQSQYQIHPSISEDVVTQQPLGTTDGAPHPKKRFVSRMLYASCPAEESSIDKCSLPSEKSNTPKQKTLQSLHEDQSLEDDVFSKSLEAPAPESIIPVLEQTELTPEEAQTTPMLQLSIYFDVQCSILNIHLMKATNLAAILSGTSTRKEHLSIFVVLYLDPNKEEMFHSKLVPKSFDPEFNEQFQFTKLTMEEARRESVVFRIYEGTKSSKGRFIGSVMLPLCEVDLFGVITTMKIDASGKNLPTGSKGDALISLRYDPIGQVIQGTVFKLTNLQKQDVIGSADPYMKVYLMHKGVRKVKWKSSVKRNTLTPIFNESFEFDVSRLSMQNICLEFVVMDYDRFSRNDVVGGFFIGERVFTKVGRTHWDETVSSPRVAVSHWHSVQLSHANYQ